MAQGEIDSSDRGEHDLVVIGASAGGVETLRQVVAGLPVDLQAAVCVVLHIAPNSPSALAAILERAGSLPCRAATDGAPLVTGEIRVAPPDRHLVVRDGRLRVTVGPRENNHRPAIDVLFRSAAERGARVIGVILSGMQDDGTAGLARIKSQGGAAIVQDPEDALYPGMPLSAIANVAVDAVVPAADIASTIARMVNGDGVEPPSVAPPEPPESPDEGAGSGVSICPECGGVLSEHDESGAVVWRCRVGHRYSPASLVDAQAADVEAALWAAVRILEDRHTMLNRMARQLQDRGQSRSARSLRRRAGEAQQQADVVRDVLGRSTETTLRPVESEDDLPEADSAG